MRKTLKKPIIFMLVAMLAVFAAGCGKNLNETVQPFSWPEMNKTPYDDFDGGMSSFLDNYLILESASTNDIDEWDSVKNSVSARDPETGRLFDNLKTVLSLADIAVLDLYEYDMLKATADYYDRAEGELCSSGYYGYKIKQTSSIKFGCDASAKGENYMQSGTLKKDKSYLDMASTRKLSDTVDDRVSLEICLFSEHEFAMRYAISVVDSKNQTVVTKIIYMLLRNGTVDVAYYEGNSSVSKLIKFSDLIDYNLEAMMFGVGCNVSFETALTNKTVSEE